MSCFIDVFRPTSSKVKTRIFDGVSIFGGSLFLTLLSKVAIPLGFTPVPFSLAIVGVFLIGALLGSKKGALAVLTYLAQGAIGLPVFAPGSAGLIGPTGGYLMGYALCAFIVGFFLEKGWRYSFTLTALAMAMGALAIYTVGYLYLSLFVGLKQAFCLGVVPFIGGAPVKIALAAGLVPSGWKLLQIFNQS